MMLIRYITQVDTFYAKRNFYQTNQMVCYEKFFKEIDDLIIDSLGIVAFISFFVGVAAIQTALNLRIH
jgi:phospholipid/cholesterol/gamma-HCH transport system permease protein